MSKRTIIDGHNLLFAMHADAPMPHVGRETMVRVIDRWAKRTGASVTIVFDGARPPAGLERQMATARIEVSFSAPRTADDVIIRMIQESASPTALRIVTSDSVIAHDARHRKCEQTPVEAFVKELFPPAEEVHPDPPAKPEKPQDVSTEQTQDWLDRFDASPEDDEPFDGYGAMIGE